MLEKTVRIGHLADFYKGLLTKKQQEFIDLYYFENLSLGEIASRFHISRQAVYDHLQRAEKALEEYENKLGLVRRDLLLQDGLKRIKECTKALPDQEKKEILTVIKSMEKLYEGDWT